MRKNGIVFGVGINDSEYSVKRAKMVDGKFRHVWVCPYYGYWRHMLSRCYSKKISANNSSYEDCIVCDEWLVFSNFRSWMINQDWRGNQLDKDIIDITARIYSPDTCAFVTKRTNTFITNSIRRNTKRLAGFTVNGKIVKAQCRNPFTGKNECLGSFRSQEDAHVAWRRRKHEIAMMLAETESDQRVKLALSRLFV